MTKLKTKLTLSASAIILVLMSALVVSAVNTGPYLYVEPYRIPTDGTTYINIRPTSDPAEIQEMSDLGPPSTYQYCVDDFLSFTVSQVKVMTPSNDEYMLGDASGPGGISIMVYSGDEVQLPYGPGVGSIDVDGTDYYWWRTRNAGNPVSPNERIDLVSNPSPTGTSGGYSVDVEGISTCGENEQNIRIVLWFNIFTGFEVPEFAIATPIVASAIAALWFVIRGKKQKQ
jgi:hypothetical protein